MTKSTFGVPKLINLISTCFYIKDKTQVVPFALASNLPLFQEIASTPSPAGTPIHANQSRQCLLLLCRKYNNNNDNNPEVADDSVFFSSMVLTYNLKPHELRQLRRHHLHFIFVFSSGRSMSYLNSCPSSNFFFLVLLFTATVLLSISLSEEYSESALSFVKLVASTSYLIVRAVFAGTAYFLAFVINGLRIPGEALHSGLQQLAEATRSFANYLGQIVVDALSSLVSFVLELVKGAVEKFIELAMEGTTALAEKGKEGIEGLFNVVVEVAQFLAEVVSGVVAELWNAFKEAVMSVVEKGE